MFARIFLSSLLFLSASAAGPDRLTEGLNLVTGFEQLSSRAATVAQELHQLTPSFTAGSGLSELIPEIINMNTVTQQVCNAAKTASRSNPEAFIQIWVYQVGQLADVWCDRMTRMLELLPRESAAVSVFEQRVFEGVFDEFAAMRFSLSVFTMETDFENMKKQYGGVTSLRVNYPLTMVLQYMELELPVLQNIVSNEVLNGRAGTESERAFHAANSESIRALAQHMDALRSSVASATRAGPSESPMKARLPQVAAMGSTVMGEIDEIIRALPASREGDANCYLFDLRTQLKIKSRVLGSLLKRAAVQMN